MPGGFFPNLTRAPVPGVLQPQGPQQSMPSPQELAALAQRQLAWEAQRRQQLSGLPEAVQRSIMQQPGYSEGGVMAPELWWNQAEGGQLQRRGPQREERLQFDRREALGIPNPDTENPWLWAMPEGGMWSSRPPGVSPFDSPFNQPLRRRGPALY